MNQPGASSGSPPVDPAEALEDPFGAWRADFPALQNFRYFNTATFGLLSGRSEAAMRQHLSRRNQFACSDFMHWFDDVDRLRALCAQLISAQAEDICFIPNACTAFSTLLNGMFWHPGDVILTVENDFPNQYYQPSLMARTGVTLQVVPADRLAESITPATRLVCISQISYITGYRQDLAAISRVCKGVNALLYVDATQALGALPLHVGLEAADMVAVDGYKWMMAPTGAGFAYVSPDLRRRLRPQVMGWRSHREWRNVDALHTGAPVLSEDAEKYEGGMLDFMALYALRQSVQTMLDLGPENIAARINGLVALLRQELAKVPGATWYDYANSPIVSASIPGIAVAQLVRQLQRWNIIASARHGRLRLSLHGFNNTEDVVMLGRALRGILEEGGGRV